MSLEKPNEKTVLLVVLKVVEVVLFFFALYLIQLFGKVINLLFGIVNDGIILEFLFGLAIIGLIAVLSLFTIVVIKQFIPRWIEANKKLVNKILEEKK